MSDFWFVASIFLGVFGLLMFEDMRTELIQAVKKYRKKKNAKTND